MSDLSDHSERTVVVIDDNVKFLQVVRAMLREFGFGQILEFTDPAKAFIALTRTHVDLILTDLVMAPVNGFKFSELVRHADLIVNRIVPIVLMTGHAERTTIQRAINFGIDEVLVKPFSAVQIHERLTRVLDRPRIYIKTPTGYFGPDRRRRSDPHYMGPERRQQNAAVVVDSEMLDEMHSEAVQKYGKAARKKLELKPLAPILTGPITTIPVASKQPGNATRTVLQVPSSLKPTVAPPTPAKPVAPPAAPAVERAPGFARPAIPAAKHPPAPPKSPPPADDVFVLDL